MKNISGVKKLNAREIGQELELDIALYIPEGMTVSQGEKIKREAKKVIGAIMDRRSIIKIGLFPVQEQI